MYAQKNFLKNQTFVTTSVYIHLATHFFSSPLIHILSILSFALLLCQHPSTSFPFVTTLCSAPSFFFCHTDVFCRPKTTLPTQSLESSVSSALCPILLSLNRPSFFCPHHHYPSLSLELASSDVSSLPFSNILVPPQITFLHLLDYRAVGSWRLCLYCLSFSFKNSLRIIPHYSV